MSPSADEVAGAPATDWIVERLRDAPRNTVAWLVPSSFEAYARVLHPVENSSGITRWREAARWSGLSVGAETAFHHIALPRARPPAPPPWDGQGPLIGSLWPADASVILEALRSFTTTPDRCWFGVWTGYGHLDGGPADDGVPESLATGLSPLPQGPIVSLSHQDYLILGGPVEDLVQPVATDWSDQTPNLAWPEDRAWFVATDIDLGSTYIGGPGALIERLVADERIEALRVAPEERLLVEAPLVRELVDAVLDDMLGGEHVRIETSMGAVEAWLEKAPPQVQITPRRPSRRLASFAQLEEAHTRTRPAGPRRALDRAATAIAQRLVRPVPSMHTRYAALLGHSGEGVSRLRHAIDPTDEVRWRLTRCIIELVESWP